FIERAGTVSYTQLARVLVLYNNTVGFAANLNAALDEAFRTGTPPATTPAVGGTTPTGPPAAGTLTGDAATAATSLAKAYEDFKVAQRNNNYADQAKALAEMDAAVGAFQQATGQTAAPAPAPGTPGG